MLSITSGTPCACAIAATASMSSTLSRGLAIVSAKIALVLGRSAARKFSGSSGSTKLHSMPKRSKVTENCDQVPPYSVLAATM